VTLRLAVLLLALLAPAATVAQTQLELTSKAADELSAANKRLGIVYDGIAAKYGADSKKRLKEAQDAWQLYSDKQCYFENKGTEAGTIHQMLVYQCLKALTDLRIAELKRQENCQEGDLSCVRE
jgi:uncharacterized protein YecT (DUF1311 family)